VIRIGTKDSSSELVVHRIVTGRTVVNKSAKLLLHVVLITLRIGAVVVDVNRGANGWPVTRVDALWIGVSSRTRGGRFAQQGRPGTSRANTNRKVVCKESRVCMLPFKMGRIGGSGAVDNVQRTRERWISRREDCRSGGTGGASTALDSLVNSLVSSNWQ